MSSNRALALFFVVTLALTPLLQGCQSAPPRLPAAKASPAPTLTAASSATAAPLPATPTVTPTRAPLPPIIVTVTPAAGEEQRVDAPIIITFDQPMDPSSTAQAFSIKPKVSGQVKVEGSQLTFQPAVALKRATTYQVQVATSAEAASGLELQQAASFQVTTAGYLMVAGSQPPDGATDVAVDIPLVVSFNRPVVPLTGVADQASLPQPLVITPTVDGKGEWLSTSLYQFTPARGLAAATIYSVTLKAGLADTTGGVLPKSYSFSFTTTQPTVTGWQPDNQNPIEVEAPISVTFSTAMDHASTAAAFSLLDDAGQPVSGTITWSADSAQLGFQPTSRLEFGSSYTAMVAATARPASGPGSLARAYSRTFSTVGLPAVVETSPSQDQRNADPYGTVQFRFGAPMDVDTFVTGTCTVLPRPTQVYTSYSDYDNSFYVTFDKQPATAYTVTLGARLADPYGNTLGKDFVLHFTTGDYASTLDVNGNGRVGSYNAYTATQAVVSYLNIPAIHYRLYTVPLDDFIALTSADWQAWQNYTAQPANLLNDWQLDTSSPRNVPGIQRTTLTTQNGAALGPGLYYLEVSGAGADDSGKSVVTTGRQLLARTDLNVTLKSTQDGALAWVTDLKTGKPVSGVDVRFTNGTSAAASATAGKLAALGQAEQVKLARARLASLDSDIDITGTTGADGVAQVTFGTTRQSYQALLAVASAPNGQMGVASSDWEDGISPWDFNLGSGASASPFQAYVYTDRPIYRPGQTVYWKAIVRRDNDGSYSLPSPGESVSVTVTDNEGNTLVQERMALSANGTLNGKVPLGADASPGYYNLQIMLSADLGYSVGFQVAEYRKPEYQSSATTDKPEYIQGDVITATAQASYFFGGPVKNAKVQWNLLSEDYDFQYQPPAGQAQPAYYYSFTDFDYYNPNQPAFGTPIAQGNGSTDDQGRFTVTIPADIARFAQSQRFTLDVDIMDINNQTVSTEATAIVHKGAMYIGLHPESYVARVNAPNKVDVLAVDPHSRPIAQAALTLVANQVTWYSVREKDTDGNYYWTSRAQYTPLYTQTVTTGADGTGIFMWQPASGGEYKIVATGNDQAGNEIRSAAYVWVSSGAGYVAWRQDNNDRMQLVPDKDQYNVGDTARVLVASPYQGDVKALLTIERNHVFSHQVIDLLGNSQVVSIPIESAYEPDIFVSLVAMQGMESSGGAPSYKVGLAELKVSVADKQLQVVLTPSSLEVGPRDTVTWTVETLDNAGRPVPDADVSLALVDKAVLTLAKDQAGSIVDQFYSERALGVGTATTLNVNVDRVVAQVAAAGKGGGGGGPGGIPSVRTQFQDVAFWAANVNTGPDGRAQVHVTLPDNLTTWTMDARAATADTQVGQSQVDITATKPLLVRSVLPRFFVQGDQAAISAIVQNNTQQPINVSVGLQAAGLQLAGTAAAPIMAHVSGGGNYKATWEVNVQPGQGQPALEDQTVVTFTAAGGGLSDAVQTTLPVYHYTTPEVTGTSGQVDQGENRLELVRLPADADPTRARLDVTLEPSLAAGMIGGLTYLQTFPYGCTEQTMSSFLPNLLSYQALKSLGVSRPDLEAQLPQQVGVALQRIYSLQHVDGGWGWWTEDPSDLFITSYVVFGLAKARAAGFTVDDQVLSHGVSWLQGQLAAPQDLQRSALNQQAFLIYALAVAGDAEPARAGALFAERDRLSTYARAFLALALNTIDDAASKDRIKTLLADISGSAVTSATSTHWEEKFTDYASLNTDVRTTAIVIETLARLDPQNSLAPGAVRWLMAARQGNRWETTQENAWSIMALTDWMVASGELQGDYAWQVTLNDTSLGNGTVTPQTVDQAVALHAGVDRLLPDQTNALDIQRSTSGNQTGAGQLYYSAHLESFLPVDKIQPLDRGIVVSREYQADACVSAATASGGSSSASDDGTVPPVTPQQAAAAAACPAITQAGVGDVVDVKVTLVVPNALHYLIVEDPLPAGAEAIDTSLLTTSKTAQQASLTGEPATNPSEASATSLSPYWWWTPSHTELYDDRAVMFADSLPAGTYVFNYQVQITLPGHFLTLPPTAYEMYFPEVQGRGAGSVFDVSP